MIIETNQQHVKQFNKQLAFQFQISYNTVLATQNGNSNEGKKGIHISIKILIKTKMIEFEETVSILDLPQISPQESRKGVQINNTTIYM